MICFNYKCLTTYFVQTSEYTIIYVIFIYSISKHQQTESWYSIPFYIQMNDFPLNLFTA